MTSSPGDVEDVIAIVNRWYDAVVDEAVSDVGRRGTEADRDTILARLTALSRQVEAAEVNLRVRDTFIVNQGLWPTFTDCDLDAMAEKVRADRAALSTHKGSSDE